MKKIQKVIETCYECEFRSIFNGMAGGQTKAHICVYAHNSEEDLEPFLLDLCSNGSNALPIPDNCPLEDYTEPKTEC